MIVSSVPLAMEEGFSISQFAASSSGAVHSLTLQYWTLNGATNWLEGVNSMRFQTLAHIARSRPGYNQNYPPNTETGFAAQTGQGEIRFVNTTSVQWKMSVAPPPNLNRYGPSAQAQQLGYFAFIAGSTYGKLEEIWFPNGNLQADDGHYADGVYFFLRPGVTLSINVCSVRYVEILYNSASGVVVGL